MDFSGGVNTISSPWALEKNEVLRATNMILDEHGSLCVRDGAHTVDTAPPGAERIVALGGLMQMDGTRLELAIVRRNDGTQALYRRGTVPWTSLGVFDTSYDTPQIVPWLNEAFIAAGYETPWRTDGTPMTRLTGTDIPGGAQWMVVHKNSLWAWNTAPVSSTYDGPSSLRQSDVENPENWPPANQLFLSRDDGQMGTGLAVFTVSEVGISPMDILVAFKHFSTYQITGSFGGGNIPTVDRVKTNMGCIAGRSIEFVTGNGFQGLLRLTHRGFALMAGTQDILVSEKIRPYLFGRWDITGLTWSVIHRSMAAQVHSPQLYLCACPVEPLGSLTRVFVFDLQRRAWTICEFPVPFATLETLVDEENQPQAYAGEYGPGGRVQRLFAGDSNDDGLPQPWRVRMPPQGPQLRPFYVQRILLKLFNIAALQTVHGQFAFGTQASRLPFVKQSRVSVGAYAVAGSSLAEFAEADAVFEIGLTGEVLYSEYSGEGGLMIRGLSHQVRPKPLSRPVRV
jgi:hypothetical protein